jgi:hypothetical protein
MVAGQGRAEVVMSGPADAGALPPLASARQQLSRLVIIGRLKGEGGHVEE